MGPRRGFDYEDRVCGGCVDLEPEEEEEEEADDAMSVEQAALLAPRLGHGGRPVYQIGPAHQAVLPALMPRPRTCRGERTATALEVNVALLRWQRWVNGLMHRAAINAWVTDAPMPQALSPRGQRHRKARRAADGQPASPLQPSPAGPGSDRRRKAPAQAPQQVATRSTRLSFGSMSLVE